MTEETQYQIRKAQLRCVWNGNLSPRCIYRGRKIFNELQWARKNLQLSRAYTYNASFRGSMEGTN